MPEKEGLSSKAIINFIYDLKQNEVNAHSLVMLKNNKIIFEGYYKPFSRNTLHRMFSITKSFVSAAIGILAGRGVINLDAPVVSYFPEYKSVCQDKFVRSATIRQLLQMKSPHLKSAFKQILGDDYVKAFFSLRSESIPGVAFSYDTSATHTLCALAEKISGKELISFLREEFLDKIGFSKEAYCVKDPIGISLGGSGLMARPMDIAILANVFLNNGKLWGDFEKRQVIPEWYVKEATSKQSETFTKGLSKEEKQGYGYHIWKTSHNGFMFYGLFGQIALILPDFNFVMVTTADTSEVANGVQKIFDLFWNNIYPYLYNNLNDNKSANKKSSITIAENPDFISLQKIKENLQIEPIICDKEFLNENITGKNFNVFENKYGINNLSVKINNDTGKLKFVSNKGDFSINFGIGKHIQGIFPYYKHRYIASGKFFDENTIIIKCHIIGEEIGAVYFQIGVNSSGEGILLTKKSVPSGFEEFNSGYKIFC